MARQINEAGLALIKVYEGLRLKAYQDSVGVWTIGYGHTNNVKPGDVLSDESQASGLLAFDLANAEAAVSRLVKVDLTDNQFAALVSFVFNLGSGNFAMSTLLKKINSGDMAGAAKEFKRWNRAGKKVLAGLVRRRDAEAALFQDSGT